MQDCPVCRSIFIQPRLYSCGHTVCSHCMRSCDEHTRAPFMNSLTVYKCPVCRHETLTPWFNRPRNLVVQSLCEAHESYRSREEEVGNISIPKEDQEEMRGITDLGKISVFMQEKISQDLYDELVPVLRAAALGGQTYITLAQTEKVKEIQNVADTLSDMLFTRNNIHRMVVTPAEVTFFFTNRSSSTRAERRNRRWRDPLIQIEDIESGRPEEEELLIPRSSRQYAPPPTLSPVLSRIRDSIDSLAVN